MGEKTAICTGGSRGIGKAIAEELAKMGYNLVLIAKDKKKLEKLQKRFERSIKGNAEFFRATSKTQKR